MTKYEQLFKQQFDDTLATWRKAPGTVRETELYRLLHGIKGTAASIGLPEWSEEAARLLGGLAEDGERLWTQVELERHLAPLMALRNRSDREASAAVAGAEPADWEPTDEECARSEAARQIASAQAETAAADIAGASGSLVLLVDDDIALLQLMKERLEQEGCIVLATPYPDKAIQWFYEMKPDCVALDVVMPGHSGFDLLAILQERSQRFVVPVLLISALNDKAVRIRAYQSGADDFIPKPVDPDEFALRVVNKLRRKRTISRMMLTDELTGLYNPQYCRLKWREIGREAAANGRQLVAVLFDIDEFHRLNERYGHAGADAYLHHVAAWLRERNRPDELLARWDRDRFVLLGLSDDGVDVAERLNGIAASFAAQSFALQGDEVRGTMAYAYATPEGTAEPEACVAALIEAMGEIKRGTRDRKRQTHVDADSRGKGKRRVAVIDDDPLIRNILERRLRDMEDGGDALDIRTFADGAAWFADEWHRDGDAYLLILDRMMPRMNGMEVLNQLRAEQPADKYRILMLTGIGDEGEIAQAIRAGTDDYVTKPFRLPELEARIRRLLPGTSR